MRDHLLLFIIVGRLVCGGYKLEAHDRVWKSRKWEKYALVEQYDREDALVGKILYSKYGYHENSKEENH